MCLVAPRSSINPARASGPHIHGQGEWTLSIELARWCGSSALSFHIDERYKRWVVSLCSQRFHLRVAVRGGLIHSWRRRALAKSSSCDGYLRGRFCEGARFGVDTRSSHSKSHALHILAGSRDDKPRRSGCIKRRFRIRNCWRFRGWERPCGYRGRHFK